MPQKLTCYFCCRGMGNAVDGKKPSVLALIYTCYMLGAATTAVRDLVLRHDPQTGVF